MEMLPEKSKEQAREIIGTWMSSGLLEEREYRSEAQRKDRKGLFVNREKLPDGTPAT